MKRFSSILFVAALFWIGIVGNTQAATCTWDAVAAGYWTNADDWAGGAVPGTDDDVVFNSGSVGCAIDSDVIINSLNVTSGYSGTITFTQSASADLTISNDFYLGTNATIIPTYSSTNGDGTGRVITVKGNATIDGTINGNSKGFAATKGPGAWSSHGGVGGVGGPTYGSLTQPTALGSGGYDVYVGGGAIKLSVTGTLALDGSITADGQGGNYAGAGGSIWLVAGTFTGNGTIRANGGNGGYSGGGGGRVSIDCSTSTWTGTISVAGGTGSTARGQPGTLWYPQMFPISGDMIIDASYQYYFPDETNHTWNLRVENGAAVYFHNGTLEITNIVVTNGSTLRFDVNDASQTGYTGSNKLSILNSIIVASNSTVVLSEGTNTLSSVEISSGSILDFGYGSSVYLPSLSQIEISGGSTLYLPAQTYNLNGLEIPAGCTLVPRGNTNAINEASGGTNGGPHGIGVTINIGEDASIEGTINGNTKGFAALKGPGAGWGASHGGVGGAGAVAYGSLTQPTALGSGGYDGAGGGAIKLNVTGALAFNGSVTADGAAGLHAAAGGSIWLIADALTGNGTISANGGKGTTTGGGGGRVFIDCSTSTWTGTVSVAGGTGTTASKAGQPGTLWYPQMFPISGDVIIRTGYQYYFPNLTTNYWNLTITNGTWVEFHQGNLVITNLLVQDSSLLTFDGKKYGTRDFDMTNLWIKGSINISNSTVYLPAQGTYDLSGDFNLSSGSTLYAQGTYDLSGDLNLSTGATLYALGDTNAINEASGGSTGTPHGVGVSIDVGGDANIEGTINADLKGFPVSKGPGYAGGAASYGGVGGLGPPTYGSLTQPTALGSGGLTGAGGGAIKLNVTGTLALNGSITVKGQGGAGNYAGAGGSIWLIADTFTGNGTISADGGNTTGYRGGGGGRVSIDRSTSTWTGTVSLAGGTGSLANAYSGTYFLCESICRGAGSLGCNGITLASDLSKDGGNASATNGVKLTRFVTIWSPYRPILCWKDTSTGLASNQLDNVATYDLSGLPPNTKHKIYYDGQWTNTLTSDWSGNLTNIVITLDAEHTILVEGPARGTAIIVL